MFHCNVERDYWPSGQRMEETYYNQGGKKDGIETAWYISGGVQYKISWENGRKHGIHEGYHETGHINWVANYNHGFLVGEAKDWHENGQLEWLRTYVNGFLHGESKEWDNNGKLYRIINYRRGKKDGISKIHGKCFLYRKGKLIAEGNQLLKATKTIQRFWEKYLFCKKYKHLIFLIECAPPHSPGIIGKLFPNGGYMIQEEMMY